MLNTLNSINIVHIFVMETVVFSHEVNYIETLKKISSEISLKYFVVPNEGNISSNTPRCKLLLMISMVMTPMKEIGVSTINELLFINVQCFVTI